MRAILLLIATVIVGCSADNSLVTIKFQIAGKENLLLDRWQKNLLSSRAPTAVVDFNCFAVNVVGPGIPSMKLNDVVDLPKLLEGNVCTYPGPSSLLVASNEAGSTLEVRVPVGKDRVIQVAGLTSSDGCEQKPPFANILLGRRVGDPNFSNFSDIYEVGRKTIELTPSDSDRTLTIASNFSTANDMLNCSTGNGGSGTPGTLALTPALAAIHKAGTFPLTASGGTSPYSYSVDCAGCTATSGFLKAPSVAAGLPPTTGIVTVTDATSATASATVNIYNPATGEAPVLWFIADNFGTPARGKAREITIPSGAASNWNNFSPITPSPVDVVTPPDPFLGLAGLFDSSLFGLPSVTFNGNPAAYFVKTMTNTASVNNPATVLVVSKLNNPSVYNPLFCLAANNAGNALCSGGYDHIILAYDGTTSKYVGRTEVSGTANPISIVAAGSITAFRIHKLSLGTQSSYSITGHSKVTQGSFTGISLSPGSKLYLGTDGATAMYKGAIAEVMLFAGMNGTTISNAVTYLSKKYGIAEPP